MTGPDVDVEQLLARVEELHGRVIRNDPTAEYLRLSLEHDEVPALLDLIRRQDAALTAVRELADDWLEGRTVIDGSKQMELIAARAAELRAPARTDEEKTR